MHDVRRTQSSQHIRKLFIVPLSTGIPGKAIHSLLFASGNEPMNLKDIDCVCTCGHHTDQ